MKESTWMWVSVLAFIALFVAFFPPFASFSDENEYVRGAYLLQEGKASVSSLEESYRYRFTGSTYVNIYPIGVSILLYPLSLLGYTPLFLLGLVLHLLTFWLVYLILRKLSYPGYFALLYLFHPGLVFFSRTVMSEIPSVFFFVLAFYWYCSKNTWGHVGAGLALGMTVLLRYTNVVGVLVLFLIALLYDRKKLWYMCLGILPFVLGISIYNQMVYGGVFKFGHVYAGQLGTFQRSSSVLINTLELLFLNVTALLVVYPLMLIAPFVYKGKFKAEIILMPLVFLIFFSLAYLGTFAFHYDFIRNMVIGPRYMFPIVPFLLFAYVPMVLWFCKKVRVNAKALVSVVAVILFVGALLISQQQYVYATESLAISNAIYSNTPEGSLLVTGNLGVSFVNELLGERDVIDFYYFEFPSVLEGRDDVYAVFANHRPADEFLTHDFEFNDLNAMVLEKVNHTLVYEQESPVVKIWKLSLE